MLSDFTEVTDGRKYKLDLVVADHPPWVILFQNDPALDDDLLLADLTEADFSGYARVQPTWPNASDAGNGDAVSLSSACIFTHSGGGTANTIYGMALVNDAGGFGTRLLCVYKFAVPISMSLAGENISRQVRLIQGQYPLM